MIRRYLPDVLLALFLAGGLAAYHALGGLLIEALT